MEMTPFAHDAISAALGFLLAIASQFVISSQKKILLTSF
jgi:hypothetical protein